jgi:hypothetical protein
VSDSLLAQTQQRLGEGVNEPILLESLRRERAGMHLLLENIDTGKVDQASLMSKERTWDAIVTAWWFSGSTLKRNRAWLLQFHNKAVEYAKLPPSEMRAKLQYLYMYTKDKNEAPLLARALCPAIGRLSDNAVRAQQRMECGIAAIGVERFRLKSGRWPDSLGEVLAAKFLDQVPTDYVDSKPLRYRKVNDGVVIYSVGDTYVPNKYAGDALDVGKEAELPFYDDYVNRRVEFRLWDEQYRRQPPRGKD